MIVRSLLGSVVGLTLLGTALVVSAEVRIWSLQALPRPAINLVHHDAEHPSALILSVLSGAEAPLPSRFDSSSVTDGSGAAGRWCRN